MSRAESFIAELIKQKQDSQREFIGEYQVNRILEVICSFLNGDGGWIVVGYDGLSFHKLSGDLPDMVSELKGIIAEQIFPQPLVDVRGEIFENHGSLLVNVIKGSRQPYSFKKKYFIRKGAATREATPDDVSILLRTSNEYNSTWEKQTTIDATINDLVNDEIQTTISEAVKIGRGKSLPMDASGFLNYFQMADYNQVRNGSIVLFGKDPVKFIPQCQIRLTMIPFGKTGSRFEDTLVIEDNLFTAYERLQDYFKKSLPMQSQFRHNDWDRITREKYPMDALDEALLNAMVHRDYSDISGDITINIFPDKIEITNSGEIPPDIITSKNKIKEHHSVLRNPTIAHIFYLRGKIEKLGRGLSLIKNRFEEYDLKTPEWTVRGGYTTLTLFGIPKPVMVNERIITFLKQIKIGEQFRRDDFEHFFQRQISEKTARNDIGAMVKGLYVEKIGTGPATRYVRTNKELPEIAG